MSKQIQIVSFDVPSPPNYGGVIDVYYKILALHEAGVEIILHCFYKGKLEEQKELNKYCSKVYYYPRKTAFRWWLLEPFIVGSRRNKLMLKNLQKSNAPILFEGIHTCTYLKDNRLKNYKKMVRMHNLEHNYYKGLTRSTSSIFKKIYFTYEWLSLRLFSRVLNNADFIFTISSNDTKYLSLTYPNVTYLPVFSGIKKTACNKPKELFCLYHGKLSVPENEKAALFLIEAFKNSSITLVIAGNQASHKLRSQINKFNNISLFEPKTIQEMDDIIQRAKVHVLPTFQPTGIKLKLLNAIATEAFVLANEFMLTEENIKPYCKQADSAQEFLHWAQHCLNAETGEVNLTNFYNDYSNHENIKLLLKIL